MDIKTLPKAEYNVEMSCPNCGWHGDNSDDISVTFHEKIEELKNEKGETYYHCTCCDCDFKE